VTIAPVSPTTDEAVTTQLGKRMYHLIAELYPICRSITGNGVRETLRHLQAHIPLEIHEVPSGTPVFDWTVPQEWNIRDAYVKNSLGERVIDFRKSNLHVLNYATPIHKKMGLVELKNHLFSLPDQPTLVPYCTSYYQGNWGFCASHVTVQALPEDEYEVYIDATLAPGHLNYGEYYLPGETDNEVLISCNICHPSLCNDNLSGIALATLLAKALGQQRRRYAYRFLFIPGTIGSITWLAQHETWTQKIKHGLVVACVGDPGQIHYKKSRRGDTEIDKAVIHILQQSGDPYEIIEFSPYGYDERQYCSPGFNLPVGSLSRTPYGRFPEYHTSADNLDFVKPVALADSLRKCQAVIDVLEKNRMYVNTNPKCEPQLGRRGLYSTLGSNKNAKANELAMLWLLNLSDGGHTLLEIAERAHIPFDHLWTVAQTLVQHGLLKEVI
jgi:aminopeptidase-like protein